MFYGSEEKNYGSKGMIVNYIDELITTKILKASGFIQSQAKDSTVTCLEAQH